MIQYLGLIGVAAVALPCAFASAEPVSLVYQFPEDVPVWYEMVQEMDQAQTMLGQTTEVSSSTTQRMRTELVETYEDGTFVIGNTIESIAFSMVGSGLDIEYDSTKPEDEAKLVDPMLASLAALNGIEVQFLLDPTGTILDVPNLPALQNHIFEMEDPSMMGMMEMMVQRDTLIATNEMNYKLLPSKPVEVGDQWQQVFEIPFELGNITVRFDLKLDEVSTENGDRIAEISISGEMDMKFNEIEQVTITTTDSTIAGSARFDIDDGVFDTVLLNTGYQMEIHLAQDAEPQAVISTNQKIKMARLDD